MGNNIEKAKLLNDYIKHINTLSTSSILLVVTFLEKFLSSFASIWLVAVALISFLLSILGGVVFKTIITDKGTDENNFDVAENESPWTGISMLIFWLGFVIGIIAVASFGVVNVINKVQ